jgi:hypothetical protein
VHADRIQTGQQFRGGEMPELQMGDIPSVTFWASLIHHNLSFVFSYFLEPYMTQSPFCALSPFIQLLSVSVAIRNDLA